VSHPVSFRPKRDTHMRGLSVIKPLFFSRRRFCRRHSSVVISSEARRLAARSGSLVGLGRIPLTCRLAIGRVEPVALCLSSSVYNI